MPKFIEEFGEDRELVRFRALYRLEEALRQIRTAQYSTALNALIDSFASFFYCNDPYGARWCLQGLHLWCKNSGRFPEMALVLSREADLRIEEKYGQPLYEHVSLRSPRSEELLRELRGCTSFYEFAEIFSRELAFLLSNTGNGRRPEISKRLADWRELLLATAKDDLHEFECFAAPFPYQEALLEDVVRPTIEELKMDILNR